MSLNLRVELIIFALLCIIMVLWVVKKEKLLMKYALVWLVSVFLMIIAILIPSFIERVSVLLGFETTSNMIFFFGIIVLLYIAFTLTIIVSKQSSRIRLLVQEVSLLKKKKGSKK
jgi:hypothetical protein